MAGETEWHSATTENISSGGALIQTEASTVPEASLEMVISLPPTGSDLGGFLVGRGRVLRSSPATSSTGVSRFAIDVTRYHLGRLKEITDMIEHWNRFDNLGAADSGWPQVPMKADATGLGNRH